MQFHQTGNGAWNRDRARTKQRRACVHVAAAILVQIPRCCQRSALAKVEGQGLIFVAQVQKQEATAAETGGLGSHNRNRKTHSDCRIHNISTGGIHGRSGPGGLGSVGRDHKAPRTGVVAIGRTRRSVEVEKRVGAPAQFQRGRTTTDEHQHRKGEETNATRNGRSQIHRDDRGAVGSGRKCVRGRDCGFNRCRLEYGA